MLLNLVFLSVTRGYQVDLMLCITPNGIVRWKLYVEPVANMDPIGVSNIISDREGFLFYTISWSSDTIYTAKICRITHVQTLHSLQKCIENNQLYMNINSPLALNDNEIDSVPIVLNKTNLDVLWLNRHVFGAGMNGYYRYNINTDDISSG